MKRRACMTACMGLLLLLTHVSVAAQQDQSAVAAAIQHALEGRDDDHLILDAVEAIRVPQHAALRSAAAKLNARMENFESILECDPTNATKCRLPAGAAVAVLQGLTDGPSPRIRVIVWRNGGRGHLAGRFFELRMIPDPQARHGWKVAEVLSHGVT